VWNDWKTKFLLIADLHAPRITRKVRSEYALWITDTIKKSIDIAEAFNTFFCEVGPNLAKNLPNSNISPESYLRQKESKFELQLISVEQVYKLLSTNKVSKELDMIKYLTNYCRMLLMS
jgi:hypothetical protein